jgi:hypothetical protein
MFISKTHVNSGVQIHLMSTILEEAISQQLA